MLPFIKLVTVYVWLLSSGLHHQIIENVYKNTLNVLLEGIRKGNTQACIIYNTPTAGKTVM